MFVENTLADRPTDRRMPFSSATHSFHHSCLRPVDLTTQSIHTPPFEYLPTYLQGRQGNNDDDRVEDRSALTVILNPAWLEI